MTNRGRIILAENNASIAEDLSSRLVALGYSVNAVAVTGPEAVQKTDEFRPDLVLVDMQLLGVFDGIEAADQIRAGFQIPVVYLTDSSDEYSMQRAKVTDPFGYLFKPFEDRELEITIEMALY